MTATPRVYRESDISRITARNGNYYSMDDDKNYGLEFFRYGFSQAVKDGNLSDYKVMVLAIPDNVIGKDLQTHLIDENNELEVSDVAKITGCFEGLKRNTIDEQGRITQGGVHMKRAVAFCRTIKESKKLSENFSKVTEKKEDLVCHTDHVDGNMNAGERTKKIQWLKEDFSKGECRILFNARCLSEGVDVPALDSVMFLSPKNSDVDVVQSVGRVMRKSPNKKYGYVIIPVVVPHNEKPSEALKDHKRYKTIWQVVQALRSHDDRLKHEIQKIELNGNRAEAKINIIGITPDGESANIESSQLNFDLKNWEDCIYAKLVEKCGDKMYWDDWAKDVTKVAEAHVKIIKNLLRTNPKRKKQFEEFVDGLQKILNPSVNQDDAIEMVAQHIITKPIFKTLFPHSSLIQNNPISQVLEELLVNLEDDVKQDVESLNKIYMAIQDKAQGMDDIKDKQKIIKELYSKFFEKAFPKKSDKLGIVYTPIAVIDFIIQSTEYLLNKHLKESLNDKGVKILEPFAGSGTFVARLLHSKIIKKDNLLTKYKEDIFANEILLLAHYISQVNIEESFAQLTGFSHPFQGGTLADTFQMYEENENGTQNLFPVTHQKIKKQKQAQFKVIFGNPPYSASQKSESDNNQNTFYPQLHKRFKETYVASSKGTQKIKYDSYLLALRQASDSLKEDGVISFITNGSFLKGTSYNGVRHCLEKEFDSVYIYNLKGNQNTKGQESKKQGGKVFGQSARTPVSIFFLVKNSKAKNKKAQIHYYEVPDYLLRDEKLSLLSKHQSIRDVPLQIIKPDQHGDWLNQRDDSFYNGLEISDNKDKKKNTLFDLQSCGVCTNRDAWVYNFSKKNLSNKMKNMIHFYHSELNRLKTNLDFKKFNGKTISSHLNSNNRKISWTCSLKQSLLKEKRGEFTNNIQISQYRPFQKKYLYFDKMFNERLSQNPRIWFDKKGNRIENKVIAVSGKGAKSFSVLMTEYIADLQYMNNTQLFPQYYFDNQGNKKQGVSDWALHQFQTHYKNTQINKDEIFYYIYGVLNSLEYQEKFKNALIKELPRIPLVSHFSSFKECSKKGKQLADLHLEYENHPPLSGLKILNKRKETSLKNLKKEDCNLVKMKLNNSTIHFNNQISVTGIPKEAFRYMIGEWSAIKWVVGKYEFKDKDDKKTGIVQNPNLYSEEGGLYVLKLLLSVITLSVKSLEIIESLPSLGLLKKEKEFNKEEVILKSLVFTMISDNEMKESERNKLIKGYKNIMGNKLFEEEINSQVKSYNNGDWSRESLLEEVEKTATQIPLAEKNQILDKMVQIILADGISHEKEIQFFEDFSESIKFPKEKLNKLVGKISGSKKELDKKLEDNNRSDLKEVS